LALLVLVGLWTNVGLALLQQRLWGPAVDAAVVQDFVATRLAVDRRLHWADPVVHRVDELPSTAAAGDWYVLGDCEALYLESGVPVGFLPLAHWLPVERAGSTMTARLVVNPGTHGVLAEVGKATGGRLLLESLEDHRARLRWRPQGGEEEVGTPFGLRRASELTITADAHVDQLQVRAGRRAVLSALYLGDEGIVMRRGTPRPAPDPALCRGLLRSAHE